MNDKRAAWWAQVRARGVGHLILVRGILLFAFVSFALVLLVSWATGATPQFFDAQLAQLAQSPQLAALLLAGGAAWGGIVHAISEWRYRRYLRRRLG